MAFSDKQKHICAEFSREIVYGTHQMKNILVLLFILWTVPM